MNAWDYMTSSLASTARIAPPVCAAGATGTKTDRMRELLRSGRCYSRELAAAAGVAPALVVPLLKTDLASGRVRRVRDATGRLLFELDAAFDAEEDAHIKAAVALLRRRGYVVRAPYESEADTCEH